MHITLHIFFRNINQLCPIHNFLSYLSLFWHQVIIIKKIMPRNETEKGNRITQEKTMLHMCVVWFMPLFFNFDIVFITFPRLSFIPLLSSLFLSFRFRLRSHANTWYSVSCMSEKFLHFVCVFWGWRPFGGEEEWRRGRTKTRNKGKQCKQDLPQQFHK